MLYVIEMAYLFGKTKNTGEVNMYPIPLQDLYGWTVRSLGAGFSSVVIAADTSVFSFGASPCFGELVRTQYINIFKITKHNVGELLFIYNCCLSQKHIIIFIILNLI